MDPEGGPSIGPAAGKSIAGGVTAKVAALRVQEVGQGGADVAQYLLIESSSPWGPGPTADFYRLARDLALQGHDVTLYLVQNGVLAARVGAREAGLADVAARVRILADDFSLRERGISAADLRPPVRPAPIETVADLLADGVRAVWH
jgi:hypothetical protein